MGPHCMGEAQVPLWQVSSALHVTHAAPAWPQCAALVPSSQTPPLQHPGHELEQLAVPPPLAAPPPVEAPPPVAWPPPVA